jgi:TMEM175 potassium channel family protein
VQDNDEEEQHHYDTTRLEAFSDGVFAIAITLLVLEITVPHVTDEGLASALGDEWASFFGFGLSFITIGIMWINHHALFRDVERVDHVLLVLNLLLLLGISFVPFATAVLAENLNESDPRLVATLLYAGTFTTTAVFFNAIWLYASRGNRLIDRHTSAARVRARTLRYLPGPALYAAGLPLAFISPWLTLGLYVALAVLYLLPMQD